LEKFFADTMGILALCLPGYDGNSGKPVPYPQGFADNMSTISSIITYGRFDPQRKISVLRIYRLRDIEKWADFWPGMTAFHKSEPGV
jgi:hypothetical protein